VGQYHGYFLEKLRKTTIIFRFESLFLDQYLMMRLPVTKDIFCLLDRDVPKPWKASVRTAVFPAEV